MTSVIKFSRLNRHPGDRAIKLLEDTKDYLGTLWHAGTVFHDIVSRGFTIKDRRAYVTVRTPADSDGVSRGHTTFYGSARE